MKYVTKKIALSAILATLGLVASSNAGQVGQKPRLLDNIGQKALETCRQLSGSLKETDILAEMKGQWTLIVYASRIKAIAKKIGSSYLTKQYTNGTPIDHATVQAIITTAVPILKTLIIRLLDLSEKHAEIFWTEHRDTIIASLEAELRNAQVTQTEGAYILSLLKQEHFEAFIAILGNALKKHLNSAPPEDKAMVTELRKCIAAS